MSYAITTIICRKCGKSFEWRKKCISSKEAAEMVEWATSGNVTICPDCYRKEMQIKKDSNKAETKAKTEKFLEDFEAKLPELTGSSRQVDWANSIRDNVMDQIAKFLSKRLTPDNPEQKRLVIILTTSVTDAAIWIKSRSAFDYAETEQDTYNELVKMINNISSADQ